MTRRGFGNYDRQPRIDIDFPAEVWSDARVWEKLAKEARGTGTLVVECYPGVDTAEIISNLQPLLPFHTFVDTADISIAPDELSSLLEPYLTSDRVFGRVCHLPLTDFFDSALMHALGEAAQSRPTVVVGWGAALLDISDRVLVLADMPRWEIQRRHRRGAPNWGALNSDAVPIAKYKRGYFVEWPIADRHKQSLLGSIDFLLDTTNPGLPRIIEGQTLRRSLTQLSQGPFRLVPFFDPGVWGGQWMREVCDLDGTELNFAWCFDCVPEENSLLLSVDSTDIEIPAMDLTLFTPRALLGELTFARFGAEFPIRFDFLDTIEGQNLSLQVHPLTDYIRREFGMTYTQDESYYLLDAVPGARVYLGVQSSDVQDAMMRDLESADHGDTVFDADKYINSFPATKHDHFLIPAGTPHASGAGSMVLEISATPFIFTFKMWDWDRVGLDGRPRPIHLDHAFANIQWSRDSQWVSENLVNQVVTVSEGDGWREERTGLHELEFIEVRRHWFSGPVHHASLGTVQVLNLVEGVAAVVSSPSGHFKDFTVHYAETFVVPAAAGDYAIRPSRPGDECATVKAWVRGTETHG